MRRETYDVEHSASLARKAQPPKNLLGWFLEAFRAETPDAINGHDVFVGQPDKPGRETLWARDTKKADLSGGSLLGSPREVASFRRFIEDGPFQKERAEYEGHKDAQVHYAFPLRAALAELAGRGRDTDDYPFMARTLYRTALRDGDWDSACASMGICEPVRKVYIQVALERLWARYDVEPPARSVRTNAA
jgi:hypothetical protein